MSKHPLWIIFPALLAGFLMTPPYVVLAAEDVIADTSAFQVRVLKNDVYGPGEQFIFDVKYGIIKGGEAGIEILPDLVTWRGAPCLHIHTWAKSSKTFSAFFKVDDQINSYLDARGIFSWFFNKRLNEGSYHDFKEVDYDHRALKAYTKDEGVLKYTNDILRYVQDAISSLYYYRLQPFQVGQTIIVNVYDINEGYALRVDVVARETIKVPAGTFRCLKIEPRLESAGIFKGKGKMNIWFSDDLRHIPVMMQTKVPIGSISAQLKTYIPGSIVNQDCLIVQDPLVLPDSTRSKRQ
jgi:hypothetical protein